METATDLDSVVAGRVRQLRAAKGLTLDQLAALSGVSRAMISRIERAETSATAVLLVKLGSALGVTLSALFEPPGARQEVVRRAADSPTRVDPETGYRRRNVGPHSESGTEIVDVVMPPGARVAYDNLTAMPVEQFVWVLDGILTFTTDDATTELGPGDCRVMRLDGPLVFHNRTQTPVRYAVILVPHSPAPGARR